MDFFLILIFEKNFDFNSSILPRRLTKLSAKQHRAITKSIKQARILGLLPFISKEI